MKGDALSIEWSGEWTNGQFVADSVAAPRNDTAIRVSVGYERKTALDGTIHVYWGKVTCDRYGSQHSESG